MAWRRHSTSLLALVLMVLGAAFPATTAGQTSLVFGVMPYHSSRVVLEHHRPVLQFLRNDMKLEARIETAPGFKSFYENTAHGDYDIVAIAAHFARLLQVEHGFVPLVRYGTGGKCSLVVREDSAIQQVTQLSGQLLASPDRLALGTMVCLEFLRRQGLKEDRDFRVQDMATFNSAALAVERGDAAVAISAPAALLQMRPEQRARLRVLSDTDPFTNLIYMAHPRLAGAQADALRDGLLRFSGEPGGRRFFDANGFGSFLRVEPEIMSGMDVYLPETRRLLGQSPAQGRP